MGRLVGLWSFVSQPLAPLRTVVFDKITALLASEGGGSSWTEEEWMNFVIAVRGGSVDETARLSQLVTSQLAELQPALWTRLMKSMFAPAVDSA